MLQLIKSIRECRDYESKAIKIWRRKQNTRFCVFIELRVMNIYNLKIKLMATPAEVPPKSAVILRSEQYKPYFIKAGHSKGQTRTKWSQSEHQQYIKFLRANACYFETEKIRREKRVFIRAAKLIKSKTCTQIKSHHQKMMSKHGNKIASIIHFYSPPELNSFKVSETTPVIAACSASRNEAFEEEFVHFEQKASAMDNIFIEARELFEWQRDEDQIWAMQEEINIDLFFTSDIL